MKKNKIRVAIIGKNFGYKVLSKALAKTKKFDLKAVCSSSKNLDENLVTKNFFSLNWREIVKHKEIDAIIIATPPTTQEKIINYAIKYKKHIFCEKPCTTSYKQIIKILKKIQNNKNFISHMVNYELAEIKAFKYFKSKMIKNRTKIKLIKIQWNILNRSKSKSWKNYHNMGGGLIFNYFCHVLYYIETIFGNIKSIKCFNKFNLNKKNEFIEVLVKLKNNISCLIKISSSKFINKNKLYHKLFIKTNKTNFLIKSDTIKVSDQFNIDKFDLKKNNNIKKKFFYEKRNCQDFRISPSFYNLNKFAYSIKRKKIARPNLFDAKNIHLLINKTIQSSKKK